MKTQACYVICFLGCTEAFKLVLALYCNEGQFKDINGSCQNCSDHCQMCESSENCLFCINGYWGNVCESSCSWCKEETGCRKSSGFCLEDCKNGYTGVLCDSRCSERCSFCNRTNAKICLGCAHGWYPPISCNKSCPDRCFNRSCNANGVCTNGCKNGFHGQRCELSCFGHCKDNFCHQENGTCVFGCEDKYTGTECITSEETGNTATVVAVMSSVLALVFGAVIAGLILIRRKRRMRLRKNKSTGRSSTQEENKEMLSTSVVEINESANTGSAKKEKTEESSQRQAASSNNVLKRLCFCFEEQEAEKTKSVPSISKESPKGSDTQPIVPVKNPKEERLQDFVDRMKAKIDEDLEKEFYDLANVVEKPHKISQKKNLEKEGVFPYDGNIVTVHGKNEEELHVNASYIKDKDGKNNAYIASRGAPLKGDGPRRMWKIMWENDCRTMVMLNTYEKKMMNSYWPKYKEETAYGSLSLRCAWKDKENMHTKQYIIRDFELSEKGKKPKSVRHLQYTGWPEKDVPESKENLLDFIDLVAKENSGGEMLVVHGRLGAGRTGTFIALDMLLKEVGDLIESHDESKIDIDIALCVRKLREQRVKMVENIDQYKFLYEALLFHAEKKLQECKAKKDASMETLGNDDLSEGKHMSERFFIF